MNELNTGSLIRLSARQSLSVLSDWGVGVKLFLVPVSHSRRLLASLRGRRVAAA
jgi:hypothetical protein